MGIFSSLFGFGDKPTNTSANVIAEYPEELKEYIEQAMAANQAIYEQRLGEGYKPYTGQTIAGFTPEEIASQQGLKSLVGSQGVLQQEALDLARGSDRKFTSETAKEYMSPYLRTALDSQKQEAQRQYERTAVPEFERQAVAAGGMSGLGSRAGVEAAERATGQNRLLSGIEAAGQQKAFEASQEAFRDQTTRERQAASQISTAAPNIFKSAVAEQGLMQNIGEQKRDLAQGTLDEAYLKYVQQNQFPESELARYQSAIYGNPLLKQPNYSTSGTGGGGGPGLGKTLLGFGSAALGFGSGGGSFFGNMLNRAGGGGIGSTMKAQEYVNRNMGGPVMPPVMYRKKGSIDDETKEELRLFGSRKKDLDMHRKAPSSLVSRDEQGLPSIGNIPYADKILKSNDTRSSSLAALERAAPNSVLSQSRNEAATANALDPQGAKKVREDFTEFGVADESDDAITNLENKLVDQQSLATGTDSGKKTGPSGMTSPKEAAQIATTAAEKVAKNTFDSALVIQNINKKTSTEVKGLLNSFAEKYKARAKSDPYKMQKFWFTVSANIMKKGNAFANMAEGLRIAVNDLDTTRKEKDKLLMDLEDTMTKSKIKLAGKEGESNIAYEKLNLKQKNMIAKLGTTGLAAFNKQMKENGDYIAALAAAKKAENAAKRLDAKDTDKDKLKVKDLQGVRTAVNDMLLTLGGAFGRIGKAPLGTKQLNTQNTLVRIATAIANGEMNGPDGKTGPAAVPAYLAKAARDLSKK
jgi:hypothetical protein